MIYIVYDAYLKKKLNCVIYLKTNLENNSLLVFFLEQINVFLLELYYKNLPILLTGLNLLEGNSDT